MGEISLGNLYDMNKIAMKNEKALKPFEIKDKIREIAQYFDSLHTYLRFQIFPYRLL